MHEIVFHIRKKTHSHKVKYLLASSGIFQTKTVNFQSYL
jgi:hypothetical protein